jgi:hypothetical protein
VDVNVSACLVTRGDVDMEPIIASLPHEWEVIVYDNEAGKHFNWSSMTTPRGEGPGDLAVYGRYAAIEHASHDLIYVQDDDVIVSDPQAIVDALGRKSGYPASAKNSVVCNMPPEFRPHYPDSGLVGFGAAFHRDAPQRAFERFWDKTGWRVHPLAGLNFIGQEQRGEFLRRADNVFTTLTPRVLVDVPKADCAYASDSNRMWRQSEHVGERDRMIELARQVRDA